MEDGLYMRMWRRRFGVILTAVVLLAGAAAGDGLEMIPFGGGISPNRGDTTVPPDWPIPGVHSGREYSGPMETPEPEDNDSKPPETPVSVNGEPENTEAKEIADSGIQELTGENGVQIITPPPGEERADSPEMPAQKPETDSLQSSGEPDSEGTGGENPPETLTAEAGWEYIVYENGIRLTKYLGTDTELIIPEELNGLPVRILGNGYDCLIPENQQSSIISVSIPDCVFRIESFAFEQCTALISVRLPAGMTSLNGGVFQGTALRNVIFPEHLEIIGNHAFDEGTAQKREKASAQQREWVALVQDRMTEDNAGDWTDGTARYRVVIRENRIWLQ